MSNRISETEAAIQPGDELTATDFTIMCGGWELTRRACLAGNNVRPGHVVTIFAADGETTRRALVTRVFAHYSERNDEYLPKFRVRPETKAGGWARSWRYEYPGTIERAFEAAAQ